MNCELSVVVTAHNNAEELERFLPMFLTQDYDGGYEVIVVVEKGEDDTDDALTRIKAKYPPQGSRTTPLYVTYVPDSSRYVSRKKLAVTLGVKAAKHEWVVLTEASCYPLSEHWLSEMAAQATDDVDMVLGYANYDSQTAGFRRFVTLRRQLSHWRHARRKTAYSQECRHLMFRKSMFFDGNGFDGNLKYIGGEYEFLVNKFAQPGRTAIASQPEAWLEELNPTDKQWRNRQLFHIETRRHLKRSFSHRLPIIVGQLLLHLGYLAELAVVVWGLLTSQWLPVAIAAVLFVATFVARTAIVGKAVRAFDADIALWKIPLYDIAWAWHYLYYIIRYRFTDKERFNCHRI